VTPATRPNPTPRLSKASRLTPSFTTLKHLSFAHSAVYAILLTVWLIPGLHALELVFGLAHGVGWIVMCLLCIEALRARVVSLQLAVAVAVIGAVGPFVGSYEFIRETRRRALTVANTNQR
jgi:hypothetical protein